jgi:hypothetical protein
MGKKKKSKNLIFFSKILKIANNLRIQKKISKNLVIDIVTAKKKDW